jgi:hypothetical protein
VSVSCTGPSGSNCPVTLELTVTETGKHGKTIAIRTSGQQTKEKVVVVGTANVTITAGQTKTIAIKLNKTGTRLLAVRHRLTATLSLITSGTIVSHQTISFRTTKGTLSPELV